MDRSIPMYEGDSYIRPGMARNSPHGAAPSNAGDGAARLTLEELAGFERDAGRLRSAVIAGLFASGWAWLGALPARAHERELERRLRGATDVADLEHRIREFERSHPGYV